MAIPGAFVPSGVFEAFTPPILIASPESNMLSAIARVRTKVILLRFPFLNISFLLCLTLRWKQ